MKPIVHPIKLSQIDNLIKPSNKKRSKTKYNQIEPKTTKIKVNPVKKTHKIGNKKKETNKKQIRLQKEKVEDGVVVMDGSVDDVDRPTLPSSFIDAFSPASFSLKSTLCSLPFYSILPGFTVFFFKWALLGCTSYGLGYTRFYWVLLGCTGFY